MAASDMIRVSTDTLEDLQARLRTLQGRIGSEAGAVQALAGRIDQACGANVAVSIKLPGQGTANNVQAALDACVRALRLCSEESLRIRSAVGGASSLFLQNERELTRSFNGENIGVSGEDVLPEGATQPLMGTAAEGGLMDWLRENMPGMADFLAKLMSMGEKGESIFKMLMSIMRALGGEGLSAEALFYSNMSPFQLAKQASASALFEDLSKLEILSFVMEVASGLVSDISSGVEADRVVTNAISNTLIAALKTVGAKVVGDAVATALVAAIGSIPGAQPAIPLVTAIAYPACRFAAAYGFDALMNLNIKGQPISEYIKDGVYNAYKGIGEAVEFAKEAFNTIGEYAQTGAEMIWDGVQDAGEAIAEGWENTKEAVQDGLDAMREAAQDGLEKAQEFFDNGWDFIRDSASWLIA